MPAGDTLPAIEIALPSTFEPKFNNTSFQFGEGYSQTVGNGLNSTLETIEVQYLDKTQAEMETLMAFFKEHKGAEFFWWAPPPYKDAQGVPYPPRKFICTKYKKNPSSGVTWNISATFEETANLG